MGKNFEPITDVRTVGVLTQECKGRTSALFDTKQNHVIRRVVATRVVDLATGRTPPVQLDPVAARDDQSALVRSGGGQEAHVASVTIGHCKRGQ